ALTNDPHHLAYDFIDRLSSRIDDDSIGSSIERRRGARRIHSVPLGEKRLHVGYCGWTAGVRRIAGPAAGALLRRGIPGHLYIRGRENDGADVAPFHHDLPL